MCDFEFYPDEPHLFLEGLKNISRLGNLRRYGDLSGPGFIGLTNAASGGSGNI